MSAKPRFRVIEFVNRGGSKSWRVAGIDRQGIRVRQNFTSLDGARAKQIELEADYLGRRGPDVLRQTSLTDQQLTMAQFAFQRLDNDADIMPAVEHWLRAGRHEQTDGTIRLDDAVEQFCRWAEAAPYRKATVVNLASRTRIFASLTGNMLLAGITPETIDTFLAKRDVSPITRDNDRRAVSRFFRWCCDRPRRWLLHNPCHEVRVPRPEGKEPGILSVPDVRRLLTSARSFRRGRLLGYIALGLFGGLRPMEAARLDPEKINLEDGELRVDGAISKVKRARVVPINPTLRAWLAVCPKAPCFAPGDWDNQMREIRKHAGIEHWPPDALRHTAVSNFFRLTESFGATAEWAGTSESVIKAHYHARVSTAECKAYWSLRP